MDLDDLLEDAFSSKFKKKKLKKLKKKAKKAGKKGFKLAALFALFAGLFAWLKSLLGGAKQREEVSQGALPLRTREEAPSRRPERSDPLWRSLDQVRQYRDNIAALAASAAPGSADRLRLDELSARVDAWSNSVEAMVERALSHQDDPLLKEERDQVPKAIKRLEKQLEKATDPKLRAKLERALESRRQQLAQLEQLANARQVVELKIEHALARLGLIYAQVRGGDALASADEFAHLSMEIDEEVAAIKEYHQILAELHVPAR